MELTTWIILSIIGFYLLLKGGDYLIDGSIALAKKLHISTFVIGSTIVAYGTSAPELVISIQSVMAGSPEIALGNVIGSNICNILLIIGVSSIIYPIAIDKNTLKLNSIYLIISTILFITAIFLFSTLNIYFAIISLMILAAFIVHNFVNDRNNTNSDSEEKDDDCDNEQSNQKIILNIVIGIILLPLGSHLLISNTIKITTLFNISQAMIGATLIAFGGSLPELTTSIIAARKKSADMVLGNVIGSNIFNIIGVAGITSLIHSINANYDLITIEIIYLILTTILFISMMLALKKVTKKIGAVFLMIYTSYIVTLVL